MNARTTRNNKFRLAALALLILFLSQPLTAIAAPDPQANWPTPRNLFPKVYYNEHQPGLVQTFYIDESVDYYPRLIEKVEEPDMPTVFHDHGMFCPLKEEYVADLFGGEASNWEWLGFGWRFTSATPVPLTLQYGSFVETGGTRHASNWWSKFYATSGILFCSKHMAFEFNN